MGRAFTLSALIAFIVDQVSKYWVIHVLGLSSLRPIDVLPPWLNFRYGENCGINFGLFGGCSEAGRWTLVALAVAISLAVTVWLQRSAQPAGARIAGGLLVGGALANVFDRLVYGYVLDFLNNSLPGWRNPFVYNLADVFIFAGAFGLILLSSDGTSRAAKRREKRQ